MIELPRTADVLVVGGGVVGCAIARALAGPGRSVLLVDRAALGAEASAAAAGVLAVASGAEADGPLLDLQRTSLARHAALAAALAEETGLDVEYARNGVVDLVLDEDDRRDADERHVRRTRQGFAVEWWDPQRLLREAPHANPSALGAVAFLDDAQITNDRLVDALAASARRRGATLVPGCAVDTVERASRRVVRVRAGGEWVSPGIVVLAAGAWAPLVGGLAPALRVTPARGQMCARRPAAPGGRVLNHRDGYLVPRRSGEVLVGATVEDVGFEKAVTPAGLRTLAAHVERIAPAWLAAPVSRTWAGLRPRGSTTAPVIGRLPDAENVCVATAHFRNGILLAPITAECVAALVEGTPPPVDLAPFAPAGA